MKRALLAAAFLFSISPVAWCVCRVPQPRMVCAEYSQSKAVVIARLTKIASQPQGDPDYFVYTLSVVRTLRGQSPQLIQLYEGNDSGRASFDWKLNEQYLLFLIQPSSATKNDWTIDGCGNSAPFAKAAPVLSEIQDTSRKHENGTIEGMVGTDSWTTGVPGIEIQAVSSTEKVKTTTDNKGRFSITVPPGAYHVVARSKGISIPPEPFSYENPAHVVIDPEGCAQVQFTDSPH